MPSNLEVVGPNDFYRNILGKVGPQIKAVLETRCSLAEMTSVSQNDTNFPLAIPFVPSYSDTFFSSLKGRCTYSRPNANTYVATFRWGDGKLKGYIMGYTAIRKQYTTHNIITGYVKQVTGGASGRGRGRGKPKPIYLPVFGTFSSRSITHFFGLGPGFSYEVKKDWTVGVNLLVSSITDDVGFAVITAYESQGSGLFDLALTAGSFPGNLGGFAILKMIFNF